MLQSKHFLRPLQIYQATIRQQQMACMSIMSRKLAKEKKSTEKLVFKPQIPKPIVAEEDAEKIVKKRTERQASPSSASFEKMGQELHRTTRKNTKVVRVAILGNANAGKSTFLNHVLNQKVSAVSPKVQTTRRNILGILSEDDTQYVFFDTPGIISQEQDKELSEKNKDLFEEAFNSVHEDIDVVIVMVDATKPLNAINHLITKLEKNTDEEATKKMVTKIDPTAENMGPSVAELLNIATKDTAKRNNKEERKVKLVAVLNKIDLIHPRSRMEEMVHELRQSKLFYAVYWISAMKGEGVANLKTFLKEKCASLAKWEYSQDKVTNLTDEERCVELTREKLFRRLNKEVPYALEVHSIKFDMREQQLFVEQGISVKTIGQKKIVISSLPYLNERMNQELKKLYPEKTIYLVYRVHLEQQDK